MELIERAVFLDALQNQFESMASGEGRCILLGGEAGMGKTALVSTFCRQRKNDCKIYQGSCDALFTPRPLAPLYDIAWQMRPDLWQNNVDIADRADFFNKVFQELNAQKAAAIIVFEDIHWADEATLDFIKFLARRITRIHCLFILTYRDNEIHSRHPLRNVLGQLPPQTVTRMQLTPLSKLVVKAMADEKGYKGEDVYSISGGNPFYVNEILASYSPGIPDNIKDSILAVYNLKDNETKQLWQILSVLPTGLELKYLEKMEVFYTDVIENSLESKILILNGGLVSFKHELYRRTIESSLSPLVRVALNKKVLHLFLKDFEQNQETERIVHHAKNANQYEDVVRYAPLAAKQAASLGAHIEASKLYFSAIEYYQGSDENKLIEFYEDYAYECYLTNRIKEAIIYQGKSYNIRRGQGSKEKTGNCLRFFSRLWWYDGNQQQAEHFGNQAIELLFDQPSSKAKAMAFSNMSQLKMLANQASECLLWGEKAIAMAEELGDEDTRCHALNNIGTLKMHNPLSFNEGAGMLNESLQIALKNSWHEHAARAYTNLGSSALEANEYEFADKLLDEGINYCEERDLDSWTAYMLSCNSGLKLVTGNWEEALTIAEQLMRNEDQTAIIKIGALVVTATLKMRRGETDVLPLLIEAKTKAFEARELQRIVPALTALLEYEWISGKSVAEKADIDLALSMIDQMGNVYDSSKLAFWLFKARKQSVRLPEFYEGYQVANEEAAVKASELWERLGCPYEQALTLFEGNDTDKRKAITIVQALGAVAPYEKMKLEMRNSGIKSIPRGIRKATQSNSAHLTERELDVLRLLKEGLQNKEIADRLFISAKTVDHHISSLLLKLNVKSRVKAVQEAVRLSILK